MVRVFPEHRLPTTSDDGGRWQHIFSNIGQLAQDHNFTVESHEAKQILLPLACQPAFPSEPSGIFYGQDHNPLNNTFTLFLLDITLVILTTRLVRFLLKPLKQPRIVSEMIGGIILGPSVLGHNSAFTEHIWPERTAYLVRNLGVMGFMFFIFVSGVKMDISLIKRAEKKQIYTALISIIVPAFAVIIAAFVIRKNMDSELARFSSIGGVATNLGITAFPVLYPILKELNLISSDVGRMALSTSIVTDAIGIGAIVAFEAAKQGDKHAKNSLWYIISLVIMAAFFVFILKRAMEWIVDNTPQGQQVNQSYVVAILLGVFAMGFLTDMFGLAIANGPLWLGLVIPDGPPLGAALVEKCETIMTELFMPFSFAMVGLYTDVFAMSEFGWANLQPLFVMVVTGYVIKLISTMAATFIVQMPIRDGIALSLIMSLRGQVELILFVHWIDKKMIKPPSFTLLVLLTLVATAIFTPLICIIYDPTRPYMVNKKRTVQHTPQGTEMGIVLCITDKETLGGLINLLDVSNPTASSPFSVYGLHLVELVGRAAPLFMDHDQQEVPAKYTSPDTINALRIYQEMSSEMVNLHMYTSVSVAKSMYQDICELALLTKSSLVILPYHKEGIGDPQRGSESIGSRIVNQNVLDHAPCSVGILVDKGYFLNPIVGSSFRQTTHHLALLFLGGADCRESLAYADRMVGNLGVSLTVIRFLSHNSEGDDEKEKKLDDGVVTWFWVKNEANERVIYREVMVKNGEETIAAIRAINDSSYDLWIVGRKHGINPVLLEGLTSWNDEQELGVIGDFLASMDFDSAAAVLVVQQQVLRG